MRAEFFVGSPVYKLSCRLRISDFETRIFLSNLNVFNCPFCLEVFFVIVRAKARSNLVFADLKRWEVYNFKLVENGLFPVCFFAIILVLKSIIAQFGI